VIINARRARALAKWWANDVGTEIPGFAGAFLHGSLTWHDDAEMVPTTSDVDIVAVLSGANLPPGPGKFLHHGVLLDVSFLPESEIQTAEKVLGSSHLAGSFRDPCILAVPSGRLTELARVVARDYAKRRWVVQRCSHARQKVLDHLAHLDEGAPVPDQVMAVLFGAGVTTHVLLTAGLRNPTVRKRYWAVRQLLAENSRLDIHEELLELLGACEISRPRVERHLRRMTEAFDAAKAVRKTPFFFGSDISDDARPIAINGSRVLILRGNHREAMFWIAATWSRCMKILAADALPDVCARFEPGYHTMLADLGLRSYVGRKARADRVRNYLPQLWVAAATIIASNPEITD
jgi:hypothetical protein